MAVFATTFFNPFTPQSDSNVTSPSISNYILKQTGDASGGY